MDFRHERALWWVHIWACSDMSTVNVLNLIKPHRYAEHKMRPTVTDVAWSVPVCIGWSCSVSCERMRILNFLEL